MIYKSNTVRKDNDNMSFVRRNHIEDEFIAIGDSKTTIAYESKALIEKKRIM